MRRCVRALTTQPRHELPTPDRTVGSPTCWYWHGGSWDRAHGRHRSALSTAQSEWEFCDWTAGNLIGQSALGVPPWIQTWHWLRHIEFHMFLPSQGWGLGRDLIRRSISGDSHLGWGLVASPLGPSTNVVGSRLLFRWEPPLGSSQVRWVGTDGSIWATVGCLIAAATSLALDRRHENCSHSGECDGQGMWFAIDGSIRVLVWWLHCRRWDKHGVPSKVSVGSSRISNSWSETDRYWRLGLPTASFLLSVRWSRLGSSRCSWNELGYYCQGEFSSTKIESDIVGLGFLLEWVY